MFGYKTLHTQKSMSAPSFSVTLFMPPSFSHSVSLYTPLLIAGFPLTVHLIAKLDFSEMEQSPEIPLIQMRKSVKKLGSSTERYGDPTLKRFLIARSMDPEKAAKMFVKWMEWRAQMVPLGFIPDSEVQDQLDTRKAFLQGLSRSGYPVVLVKGNRHFPSKDHDQFKKFVVHIMDKMVASAYKGREVENEKLIGVIDLRQITYKNTDIRGFFATFQIVQAYYPDRMARLYILNAPSFFASIWRIVSSVFEKANLEKIVFVRKEDEKREMLMEIGEHALPEEYGGQAEFVHIQDVSVVPLPRED